MSFFAAQGFTRSQCTKALKVFDGVQKPCMSILWHTFTKPGGDNCAGRFLEQHKDKRHTLQIHFDNGSGRRLRRLGKYEIERGLSQSRFNRLVEQHSEHVLSKLRARADEITKWIAENANPNSEILVSTGLEDGYSAKAYRVIAEMLKKTLPQGVLIGRNPNETRENRVDTFGADFIELHSLKPKFRKGSSARCVVSTDGYDIRFERGGNGGGNESIVYLPEVRSFFRRYRARGCRVFLWWSAPQGRSARESKFIDPRRRTLRVSASDISAVNKIIRRLDQ